MNKKEALINELTSAEEVRKWINDNFYIDKKVSLEPTLIRSNFYSVFDVLEKNVNQIGGDVAADNIKNIRRNLEDSILNFLMNSSIWLRFCDDENWDGNNDNTKSDSIKDAISEFKWFEDLRLYDFNSAKEYIEYNVRALKENYLAEIGGHGSFVTPKIYSNEVEIREFFIENEINKSGIFFKFLKGADENRGYQTEDVSLRILLVDDKIGTVKGKDTISKCYDADENYPKIWKCDGDCASCDPPKSNGKPEPCKLKVIRKLMNGEFILDNDKKDNFNKKTYWADEIRTYSVKEVKISCVWKVVHGKLDIDHDFKKQLDASLENNGNCVQIIGVRDLESALALMSCCKFDIILLDYLLGERTGGQTERVYSTELFEFLSYDFKRKLDSDIVTMLKKESGFKDAQLEKFRDEVKLNRGPLDKYWIVPMTSYNPSFLADLQRRNVRLIDHRWNINQGADPINTPWRFLHKLNEFVDLQLRSSVFWKSQLLTFIQYTGEDLENRIKSTLKEKTTDSCFVEFQQFMGAEYANFMKRYGSRRLIERDAATNVGNSDKSLFSTYISKKFYNEAQYCVENELNRMLQNFYHRSATMFDDQYDYQRLREVFEQMRVFIAYNKLEDSLKDEDKKKLLHGLRFLHTIIDSEFRCEKIDKWLKENAQ